MSLEVNEDNLFFVSPNSQYNVSEPFSAFMEENFTVFLRAKVNYKKHKPNEPAYLFSRNGMHSGIFSKRDNTGTPTINFTYWISKDGEYTQKIISHVLPKETMYEYNDYAMVGDHTAKKIYCFVNGKIVGLIDYVDHLKHNYKDCFIWFGCGNMFIEENYRHVGNFKFDLFFGLDKCLSINEINELRDNYSKYTSFIGDNLPVLTDKAMPHRDNLFFFLDFKDKTRYKVWNLVFNGCYPQLYIENNIMF